MNWRIIPLSLLSIPLILYILKFNGIVSANSASISTIVILVINLFIVVHMNKKEAHQ